MSAEQRICDQARAIRENGWLSEIELAAIKKRVEIEDAEDVELGVRRVENVELNLPNTGVQGNLCRRGGGGMGRRI